MSSAADEWIERLASDNYPVDAIISHAMVLAQHGADFDDIVKRVVERRAQRMIDAPPGSGFAYREPLLWKRVAPEVKLGDTFEVDGRTARAYYIHTDERGVRRARVLPRFYHNDEPVVSIAETSDPRWLP